MYINISLNYHRIIGSQSRIKAKVHDLQRQPSYKLENKFVSVSKGTLNGTGTKIFFKMFRVTYLILMLHENATLLRGLTGIYIIVSRYHSDQIPTWRGGGSQPSNDQKLYIRNYV